MKDALVRRLILIGGPVAQVQIQVQVMGPLRLDIADKVPRTNAGRSNGTESLDRTRIGIGIDSASWQVNDAADDASPGAVSCAGASRVASGAKR